MSPSVRMPLSKSSMAKATVEPAEIVSIPVLLQMSFARPMTLRSSTRQLLPSIPMVSYSGPAPLIPSNSTSRPQRIGHETHPQLPVNIVSAMDWPVIDWTFSGHDPMLQFFIGRSPFRSASATPPAVPNRVIDWSFSMYILAISDDFARTACSSRMVTLALPRATTAFRFFEPMTAPIPPLPAALAFLPSCMMLENSAILSPAGPTHATPAGRPPSQRSSSVSKVSRPQRSDASLTVTSPSISVT